MKLSAPQRWFCCLVMGYGVLLLPGLVWEAYGQTVGLVLVLVPFLTAYLLHAIGIPQVLEHNGACGWGWCAPSPFGWALVAVLWLGLAWLLACGLGRTARGSRAEDTVS